VIHGTTRMGDRKGTDCYAPSSCTTYQVIFWTWLHGTHKHAKKSNLYMPQPTCWHTLVIELMPQHTNKKRSLQCHYSWTVIYKHLYWTALTGTLDTLQYNKRHKLQFINKQEAQLLLLTGHVMLSAVAHRPCDAPYRWQFCSQSIISES